MCTVEDVVGIGFKYLAVPVDHYKDVKKIPRETSAVGYQIKVVNAVDEAL